MLSVYVEGCTNESARCGSAAAILPLAWRVRDINDWLITDGRTR
jgi:hypothetical protein